jgi:hypothetical protein
MACSPYESVGMNRVHNVSFFATVLPHDVGNVTAALWQHRGATRGTYRKRANISFLKKRNKKLS